MPSSSCVNSHLGPPLLREFRNVSANCSAFFLACCSCSTQVASRGLSNCGSINGSGKRKIVLASGVFDLLHLGHVRFLEEAKKAGGPNAELVVIVARDETVRRRKKEKPVMPENQRCALVASLKVVDEALLGFERFDVGKVVEKISPDVIAFGYDQAGMEKTVRDYIKKHGLSIKVIRVGKFSEDELDSSSKIKQKIVEDFRR